MEQIILLRYSELHLKGKNRKYFENVLISNIKRTLSSFNAKITKSFSRYIVSDFDPADTDAIVGKLTKIFGLHSLSVADRTPSDFEAIAELCKKVSKKRGSFRVTTNRADKTFPMTSPQVSVEIGGILLDTYPALTVDLHNPDFVVNIDIREDGTTYVFRDVIPCAGGMPVGTAGKGLLMLSGGIDSPVAGYMMARRGMRLKGVHFFSPPYTSEFARQKAEDLAKAIAPYTGTMEVFFVPFTEVQEAIHARCNDSFMVIIMRRIMMRIANELCKMHDLGAVVTGESLGQVASQTLESMTVTNAVAEYPVMRPLVGFDKDDIIARSRMIDTYDISIRPYDDCCTVFLPDNPQTHPKLERVLREEARLDIDALVANALAKIESKIIKA